MKKVITILLVLVILAALGTGGWMLYDNNVDRSGWVEKGGEVSYRDFHGKKVTGWQDIDGQIYYFGQEGIMATGWQEIDEMRCCFSDSGALLTGWQDIDGDRYYFDADGCLQTLWQELEGNRYYFGTDGKMVVNWQEVDGMRRWFSDTGALQTGWQEIDGAFYFLDGNGSPLTGSQVLEENTYLFDDTGAIVTGWADGKYYQENGAMATGWQEIEGSRYFFSGGGAMATGWVEDGGYRYYFQEDGTMAIGPTEIDGKLYHFSPHGVHLWLVNPWNELHEDYEVELVQSEGGFRIAAECFDAFTQMIADCRAAGNVLELASGYRSYWDQQALFSQKVEEYGVGTASQIVARPNTSEHQLGLAVDIVVPGSTILNRAQGSTKLQQWLMEHCWDYGFILRYPDGTTDITGIIYEPWHYRYVGLEIAQELKELDITLEEYLGAAEHD